VKIEKPTERQLRRLFPHISESVIKRNCDRPVDSGTSNQSKQVDRKEVCETQGGEKMGAKYSLRSCQILYFCGHGKRLDSSDNESYGAVKIIADALVNLGAAFDDKDFTSTASQRMHISEIKF
jgi:hypothetical protein